MQTITRYAIAGIREGWKSSRYQGTKRDGQNCFYRSLDKANTYEPSDLQLAKRLVEILNQANNYNGVMRKQIPGEYWLIKIQWKPDKGEWDVIDKVN